MRSGSPPPSAAPRRARGPRRRPARRSSARRHRRPPAALQGATRPRRPRSSRRSRSASSASAASSASSAVRDPIPSTASRWSPMSTAASSRSTPAFTNSPTAPRDDLHRLLQLHRRALGGRRGVVELVGEPRGHLAQRREALAVALDRRSRSPRRAATWRMTRPCTAGCAKARRRNSSGGMHAMRHGVAGAQPHAQRLAGERGDRAHPRRRVLAVDGLLHRSRRPPGSAPRRRAGAAARGRSPRARRSPCRPARRRRRRRSPTRPARRRRARRRGRRGAGRRRQRSRSSVDQVLVDERDGHRALAHGARDALDRPRPDVARHEHAGTVVSRR